jgi:hypothetical protein
MTDEGGRMKEDTGTGRRGDAVILRVPVSPCLRVSVSPCLLSSFILHPSSLGSCLCFA